MPGNGSWRWTPVGEEIDVNGALISNQSYEYIPESKLDRIKADGRWAVLDAQLGWRARDGFRIGFPVADVPPTGFRPAASIWRAIRAGTLDPGTCGVRFAGIEGAWFVAAAVLRDAAALAGIECLPWDYWGPSRRFLETREVGAEEARQIDALAQALDPAPANRAEADAVLARFPWARPSDTVISVIVTTPLETPIRPRG